MEVLHAYSIEKDIVFLLSQNVKERGAVLMLVATEASNEILHIHMSSKTSLGGGISFLVSFCLFACTS